jgi:hypothetical protein
MVGSATLRRTFSPGPLNHPDRHRQGGRAGTPGKVPGRSSNAPKRSSEPWPLVVVRPW